jgi:hypothetical protein
MSGQLRVDQITDELGTGSPAFPNKIAAASLGTGTPGSGNFLRGDGSWQIIPAPSTSQVLTATAGAEVGAVGTYAFCSNRTAAAVLPGSTVAGSNLRYTNAYNGTLASPTPSGTWRCMGYAFATGTIYDATLWLRIS